VNPVRLRLGRFGWERWNGFTDEWDLTPFTVSGMSMRQLGEYFTGRKIVIEAGR